VKKETEVYIEGSTQRRTLGVELNFGAVSVSEQVIAYQRKRLGDNKVIDIVSLDLPEQDFVTQALWYVIGDRMAAALPSEVLLGALHASEHGQIAVLPLISMCDRWDIGGLSTNIHHQTASPTIFIYDGHPGGVGSRGAIRRVRAARRGRGSPDPRVPCETAARPASDQVREPERAPPQGGALELTRARAAADAKRSRRR
jgi:ATP-dependent helicase YprA (DUF1998 family)